MNNELIVQLTVSLDAARQEIERLRNELATAKEEASQMHTTAMWLSADLATLQGAINQIVSSVSEWKANGMGGVHMQRQRWERLGDIAQKALDAATPKQPEAEPETKVLRTDTIICTECGHIQKADVTYTQGDPWPSYVHWCEKCNYIIMESEWQTVGNATNE
jgi:hypothetical protein